MEFKSHLGYIIKDFDNLVKLSNEIDYIVCWDVNNGDRTALNDRGLSLNDVDTPSTIFSHNSDEF